MRIRTYKSRSRSKYGNVKYSMDGFTFDSKAEARRYSELKILLRAGKIRDLELQKEYELVPAYRDANRYCGCGQYHDDTCLDTPTGCFPVQSGGGQLSICQCGT